MMLIRALSPLVLVAPLVAAAAEPRWTMQSSGVAARLRGVSAVSARVAWASGTGGTVIRTADGGETWQAVNVPGAGALDFRDVDALDERTALVLSIGSGDASRIYRTTDAGASWTLQFTNDDPRAFFDAMAFGDARRGFAVSDSVDGQFVILQTADGGATWTSVPRASLPAALPGEGAYAASGTNVVVKGNNVWVATTSRVLRSRDAGRSWTVAPAPLTAGPSAGIFSIAFRDERHGVIVGGDYKLEAQGGEHAAVTEDGGVTWTRVGGLSGYRSAVAHVPDVPHTVIAVGPAGADWSGDDGRTWRPIPGPGFHALSLAPRSRVGWAVGEKGAVARVEL